MINPATYSPRPDSVAGQVLALLQTDKTLPAKQRQHWTPETMATFLDVDSGSVRTALHNLKIGGLVKVMPVRYVATK